MTLSAWKPHLWCSYLVLSVFAVTPKHTVTERNRTCCRKEGGFFLSPSNSSPYAFENSLSILNFIVSLCKQIQDVPLPRVSCSIESGNCCRHQACPFILVTHHFASLFLELYFWELSTLLIFLGRGYSKGTWGIHNHHSFLLDGIRKPDFVS